MNVTKEKKAWFGCWRFLSGVAALVLTMEGVMPAPMTVYAQEQKELMSENLTLENIETEETLEPATEEGDQVEIWTDEVGSELENELEPELETEIGMDTEMNTEIEMNAEMAQVQQINHGEETVLVEKTINAYLGEVIVTVTGSMPVDAELVVRAEEITPIVKHQIVDASDIVSDIQELEKTEVLYSYDISILYQGIEYEPYVFDRSVEVTFTFAQNEMLAQVGRIEVFHVNEEEKIDEVTVKQVTDSEIVLEALAFSQYIVIGEVIYGGKKDWRYEFTEGLIEFQAPEQGIYRISLYGAQGESYGIHTGGKGGMVISYVELMKGQTINLITGGQAGYNGGGIGTLSRGGGATQLYVNGQLAAAAGGGGGALAGANGGLGGESRGDEMPSSLGQSSLEYSSAGGGGGYLGGAAGQDYYHIHQGNEGMEGGCYTEPVYHMHTHDHSCYVEAIGLLSYDSTLQQVNQIEPVCGKIQGNRYEEEGIERYAQACGKTEDTIETSIQSCGGRNYYDASVCKKVVASTGMNAGDGRVEIVMTEMYAATVYFYNYDATLLGKASVAVGDTAGCPVSEVPQKPADNTCDYVFAGWDDMATPQLERLSSEQAAEEAVWDDRSFMAVYDEIPRRYQLILDSKGAEYAGTTQVEAVYGQPLCDIILPQKSGVIFQGYFTEEQGGGRRIYDAVGKPVGNADFLQDTILYAYWMNPIYIKTQPQDIHVTLDYTQADTWIEAMAMPEAEYVVSYQWYVAGQEIAGANTSYFQLPTGYTAGSYGVCCQVTATNVLNHQSAVLTSNHVTLYVEKGILKETDIDTAERIYYYDERYHELKPVIHKTATFTIYYGKAPLTAENYETGSITPPLYLEVGKYEAYFYAVSASYQDYAGKLTMEIRQATPQIYLGSRDAFYNNEPQRIDPAVVYGAGNKKLDPEVTYLYYNDEACKTLTTMQEGALTVGGAPSRIGTYYVMAVTRAMKNYCAVKTSIPAVLNIKARDDANQDNDADNAYDDNDKDNDNHNKDINNSETGGEEDKGDADNIDMDREEGNQKPDSKDNMADSGQKPEDKEVSREISISQQNSGDTVEIESIQLSSKREESDQQVVEIKENLEVGDKEQNEKIEYHKKEIEYPSGRKVILFQILALLIALAVAAFLRFIWYPWFLAWRKHRFYVSGQLAGIAQGMRVAIDTKLSQRQISYDQQGNFTFKGLEEERPYTITIKAREGHPMAVIHVILTEKDSEYKISLNHGLQLDIQMEKKGINIMAQ